MSNRNLSRIGSDEGADESSGLLSRPFEKESWSDRDPGGTPTYRAAFSVVSTVAGAGVVSKQSLVFFVFPSLGILVRTSSNNWTSKLLAN